MLKFACVVLLLVGSAIAEEFKWDGIPGSENATQCIYHARTKTLGCRSTVGTVECPATLEFKSGKIPSFYEVFGIGSDSIKSEVSPIESRIYPLYPRKLDNNTYESDKTDLYLYGSSEATFDGVRVSDVNCFVRLVDVVLNRATAKQIVELSSGLHVEVFGEILATEKAPEKRWLFGLGLPWLLGMGMFGWGFGWGFPFWG